LERDKSSIDPEVIIRADSVSLEGDLVVPSGTPGIVLFAHGSGSSRHSPRNKFVASVLNEAKIGTLLLDLLTTEEDSVYETRFDIPLLTRRLITATQWLKKETAKKEISLGYFGASTGAAAALMAAAKMGDQVQAVVSRGGRPDLAMEVLDRVQAPTLLIVGGNDQVVIELNQQAYAQLTASKDFRTVPGATHLFEEPGTLEEVARLAKDWFLKYLKPK